MDHVRINRDYWTRLAPAYAERASENWSSEPSWGPWRIPESEIAVLGDVAGKDALELGCGTGYFSAWLARMGARPTGIDVTPAQLETARRMQAEHGITFPLIEANAEEVPLPDASFDLILSEYGASIWCDPYRWIPEASRLLRPGGDLVFLVNGTLLVLTSPDEDEVPAGVELLRDYFDMHRFEWPDEDDKSVEFHLGYGDWIRLLRANNFEVLDLVELRAPENASPTGRHASEDDALAGTVRGVLLCRRNAICRGSCARTTQVDLFRRRGGAAAARRTVANGRHRVMNRSAVSGSSQVYNPPPPLPSEVRPAARDMTTSLGSFAKSVACEPRRAKPAAAVNVVELARMPLVINRCLTPMPRNWCPM